MENKELEFVTYYERQLEIAKRFKSIRKKEKISQKQLADMSGVSYGSIRRFENTGDISLASLLKLSIAIQRFDDWKLLFENKKEYKSIEDVINDQED